MKFKIGDRVVTPTYGAGRVVEVGGFDSVGVDHDSPGRSMHGCEGWARTGHGWYYNERELVLETSAEVTTSNPIYHYCAGDSLHESAWEVLVNHTHGLDWDTAKDKFKEWEDEYKASGNPIPSAWRSAKSVIKGAMLHSVSVKREDGSVRGKTAVEKDIKAKKEAMKDHVTPVYVFARMVDRAVNYARQNGINYVPTFQSVINNAE